MKWILAIQLILLCNLGHAQTLAAGTGTFVFNQYGPLANKSVTIYYHIPANVPADAPVLMALHGEERDGNAYRSDWINAANQHKFIVIAPEFSDAGFSGGDGYNLLNLFRDGDNPTMSSLNPDSVWTTALFEPIFLSVKSRFGLTTTYYVAYGHSAGSQVLHKYVMLYPKTSMKTAICANAGWYTLPDKTRLYPYGLGLVPLSDSTLLKSFSKSLIVLLGLLDNNPNSAGLRHTQEADAQGLTRLARGRYFFSNASNLAQRASVTFNWRKVEVAGVGHDHTLMASNALQLVLDAFSTTNGGQKPPALNCVYAQGRLNVSGLQNGELVTVSIINAAGQTVLSYSGYAANNFSLEVGSYTGLFTALLNTTYNGNRIVRFANY